MVIDWIIENLNVVPSPAEDDGEAIFWGGHTYTEVPVFISMFGDVIKDALANDKNVKQTIADEDESYGKLLLN